MSASGCCVVWSWTRTAPSYPCSVLRATCPRTRRSSCRICRACSGHCRLLISIFMRQHLLFIRLKFKLLRGQPWWLALHEWRAGKGWHMMQWTLASHMLALFTTSETQTDRHATTALFAVFLPLSDVDFFFDYCINWLKNCCESIFDSSGISRAFDTCCLGFCFKTEWLGPSEWLLSQQIFVIKFCQQHPHMLPVCSALRNDGYASTQFRWQACHFLMSVIHTVNI